MASRASYKIAVIIIVSLIFSPVSAILQNAPSFTGDSLSGSPPAVPYTIKFFIPSTNQIHSDQIMDQINGPDGDVLFATSFGLSTFNGTWRTRHANLDNISRGLMDDYVTAIEFDPNGNLWIGYSGGIQIYNGVYYQVIRDQQLLKDTRIYDIQRWNDDMWVATGQSGLHRYRNGEWTWFQPMSKNGPGFYEIDSMTLDTASNSLLIATENEGLWIVRSPDDPVPFELLAGKDTPHGQMQHVKRDPLGGVYFFNPEKIIHYDTVSGFNDVLTSGDLTPGQITINDVAAGSDGNLNIATDDGIYIWKDGEVYRHLTRFEGLGTSDIVQTINADAKNRVWFATQGYVGYYLEKTSPENQLRIDLVTPTASLIPITLINVTPIKPGLSPAVRISSDSSSLPVYSQIIDPIAHAISVIAQKFGVKIFS